MPSWSWASVDVTIQGPSKHGGGLHSLAAIVGILESGTLVLVGRLVPVRILSLSASRYTPHTIGNGSWITGARFDTREERDWFNDEQRELHMLPLSISRRLEFGRRIPTALLLLKRDQTYVRVGVAGLPMDREASLQEQKHPWLEDHRRTKASIVMLC